ASQKETIKGIRAVMQDDARIVALRSNVRKAAESQLANGVIDVTALLSKISDENMALLTSKYHEIMLIQEIYKLKYTLDR
ncbi:MAG: transporter, partial [Muribaculaceae bacterium]|nr:transporter [Muribaculaceae bacterium]